MLLFSEYLRDLLQAKKMTVSALSRLSGVERTALSKALTGQRVLPYDALDALIYHLRLTPGEGQRLRAYYDAQFEKEGIRRARGLVGKLFSALAELDFVTPAFEESQLLMDLPQYAAKRSIFSGVTNVQPLLRMVLAQELTRDDPEIALTVPPTDTFLSGELLRRYLDGRMSGEVRQIIAFDASGTAEDISLHNLECFCRILPHSAHLPALPPDLLPLLLLRQHRCRPLYRPIPLFPGDTQLCGLHFGGRRTGHAPPGRGSGQLLPAAFSDPSLPLL